jgi:hypothetical protein
MKVRPDQTGAQMERLPIDRTALSHATVRWLVNVTLIRAEALKADGQENVMFLPWWMSMEAAAAAPTVCRRRQKRQVRM